MTTHTLAGFSEELARIASSSSSRVVQVHGGRRPASGIIHGPETVITMAGAVGREDGVRIRLPNATDGIDAQLAGWDPASGIAVLRAPLGVASPPEIAAEEPRVAEIVIALARSNSNSLTASVGNVAVVGGPLRTGRRREIARVVRITAPLHEGFAGGGVFDTAGRLTAVATAATIRGYAVAIPASIAWAAAAQILASGTRKRGFVGIAVQPARLSSAQQREGRERGLLIVGVSPGGPADSAGLMVGDILLDVAGRAIEATDDLLEQLTGRAGEELTAYTLRGLERREVTLTVGERPS